LEGVNAMACSNCGSDSLIKAHLIPRVFAVEVKVGKSFAANVLESGTYRPTQSGIWDNTILCAECDGVLGNYENYAYGVTRRIRATEDAKPWQQRTLADVDVTMILKFCAGILYKFSLTSTENGRVELGRYQESLRHFLFHAGAPCPAELDVLVLRPLRYADDADVFAYRAPRDDRAHGLNFYRMMLGGVIFFVNLDARGTELHAARGDFIKAHTNAMKFTMVDALKFEEFTVPAGLVHTGRLSGFLDRVVPRG
jgi:hypothetical protein